MRPAALLAALALLAAGCGGEQASEAEPPPAPPLRHGTVDAGAAEVLRRYVAAARSGDTATLWGLLTPAAQASLGPSLDRFRRGEARRIHDGFRFLLPGERVLLARRVAGRAVAAVTGERRSDEQEVEPYAHAIALTRAGGRWRVDVGGVHLDGLAPDPLEVVETAVPLAARVSSSEPVEVVGAWLDGDPLHVAVTTTSPFALRVEGRRQGLRAGRHDVVVLAATPRAAAAVAWPFVVEEG